MSTVPRSTASLLIALEQLQQATRDAEWAANLEDLCLEAWVMLGEERRKPEVRHVADILCDMLQDHDCFQLAGLVVPDLRDYLSTEQMASRSLGRQIVLKGTLEVKNKLVAQKLPVQDLVVDPGYLEEKAIFAEAEFHKACLLLYTYANLSEEQKQQVKAWMDARPGAKISEQA